MNNLLGIFSIIKSGTSRRRKKTNFTAIVGFKENKKLRDRRRNLKNITLLGNVNETQLIDLYSRCKALIYSTYHCELGLVCIEAMASGKPAIAVNEGGPTEYVDHGKNGFLFSNSKELKRVIQSSSKDQLERMKEECIQTVGIFDIPRWQEILRDQIESVYAEW